MKLRQPRKDDFSALKLINEKAHPNPWSDGALQLELSLITSPEAVKRGYWGTIAESGADIAGYLFSRRQGDDFELMVIGVSKEHQRQGVGRLLMNALTAEVLSHLDRQVLGNAEIFLEVSATNTAALSLYLAVGFSEFSRRRKYYSDGSDGVCMKLKVAKP